MNKFSLLILSIALWVSSNAAHIVGGELYYTYLGSNNYQVTLKLYRDCNCVNCAPYGDPEWISIFRSDGTLYDQIALPLPPITNVNPPIDNPCLVITDVCVESAVYTNNFTVNLPPINGGYYLVYQRCCRNNTISNIVLDAGATYVAHVPTVAPFPINSSPRFTNFPPIFVCVNAPFVFNHSATDPDGDSLVYSIITPFDGGDANCPNPSPDALAGCPTAPLPPPYNEVFYTAPYTAANPMNLTPGSGNIAIDPITGLLTVTPDQQGQFVIGVKVEEYRGGVKVGETIRDFQFNVVQCNVPITQIPSNNINPITGIGIFVNNCSGFQVNFTNNTYNPPPTAVALSFEWDFGDPTTTADVSNLANPVYTYSDTGTYLVQLIAIKGTGPNACRDTALAYVKVYPSYTTDFQFVAGCENQPVLFTDASNSTINSNIVSWNWRFGDNTSSNQQNPSHLYSNEGTYNVRLISTDQNGCIDTMIKQVTVLEAPNSAFSSNTACLGDTTILSYTGGSAVTMYNWTFPGNISSSNSNPHIVIAQTGSVSVSLVVELANGCKDTATQNVNINPLPIITMISDTTICPFTNVEIYASGGVDYLWTPSQYLSDTTISNPFCSPPPQVPLEYFVTVTDLNGCVNTDSFTLSFFPIPNIDAGPDTSVCLNPISFNPSAQLQASGGISYQWWPGAGLNSTSISNPIASPTIGTMYFVQGTASTGCSMVDSVFVAVLDPNLDVVISEDTFMCVGNPIQVSVINQGASGYVWSPPTAVSNINIYNPFFNPVDTTLYILTINNYCYSKSDSILINVIPLPKLNAIPLDSICIGDSLQLNAEDAVTYVWTPSATLSDANISNPFASPIISTTYVVTGTNQYGCVNSDTTVLLVYYPPITDVQPDTAFICYGDAVQLVASGGVIYEWTPDPSLSSITIANPIATPTDTTRYYVKVTNIHGCFKGDSIQINVQLPVTASATNPFDGCFGVPFQLDGSGGLYYFWSPADGLTNPFIANPIATPDSTTQYTLTVSNDCFTDSTFVDVIIHPLPFVNAGNDTTIFKGTIALLGGTTLATQYFWYPSEQLDEPFQLNTIATPQQSGYFYLFVIDQYGCQNLDSVYVSIEYNTVLIVPSAFSPNGDGTNDFFRIIKYLNIQKLSEFSVWNRWGEKIWYTNDLNAKWDGTYKGKPQELGVYLWKIDAVTYEGEQIQRNGNLTLIR